MSSMWSSWKDFHVSLLAGSHCSAQFHLSLSLSLSLSPASVIRFAEPKYVVEETLGHTSNTISIVRSGYLNSTVDVFCRLKGVPDFGNATARDRPGDGADFITPPEPSKVTLQPGDTTNKGN